MLEAIPYAVTATVLGAMLLLAFLAFRGGQHRGLHETFPPPSTDGAHAAESRQRSLRLYQAMLYAISAAVALGTIVLAIVTIATLGDH